MVTVYDVPPDKLIAKTAAQLKQMDTIQAPDWAEFVKTGMHTEKAPIQPDWWYIRTASVLRKVFLNGPIGSSRLAAEYAVRNFLNDYFA
ncbi:MAG TPA: 40S ribosomal protein S19, partial [Methanomassiliicoccaceae archaeon]|nr:40S ribosomal protein S19 [Methanomassiliicoccaceae archaeon]